MWRHVGDKVDRSKQKEKDKSARRRHTTGYDPHLAQRDLRLPRLERLGQVHLHTRTLHLSER